MALVIGVAALIVAGAAFVLLRGDAGDETAERPETPPDQQAPDEQATPLQRLIDDKCASGGVVALSGTYLVDDTVVIRRCRNLTIEGNGAVLETDQPGPFTSEDDSDPGQGNGQEEDQDEQGQIGEENTGTDDASSTDGRDGKDGQDKDGAAEGDGTVKKEESKRVHVLIEESSGIVIRDLTVRGPNRSDDPKVGQPGVATYDPRYAKEHGFAIRKSSRVRLEDNRVDAVFGDGVSIGQGMSTDIVVSGLTVERNGRQGVHLANVSGALIERVNVVNGRRGGVDFEPPGSRAVVENVEVRDSTFRTQLLAFPAVGGQGEVRNIKIYDNVVLSALSFMEVNGGHNNFEVYANTGQDLGAFGGAMVVVGPNVSEMSFRDNRFIPRSPDKPAFKLESATGVTITGNDVRPGTSLLESDVPPARACSNTTAAGDGQPTPCGP